MSRRARSQVLGFVPTGWYPTAAKALADGRLVVLNGKGIAQLSESERAESDQASRTAMDDSICRAHSDRLGILHSRR